MEPLYAKLYDKYTKLKAKKFGDLEELNKDQEEKFINYISAAEELIQHLRDENDSLRAKLNELVSSSRPPMDDQGLDYQKLLMEEIHKNKELSEEVEKLYKLQKGGAGFIPEPGHGERGQLSDVAAPENGPDMSEGPVTRSRKKRARPPEGTNESPLRPQNNFQRDGTLEDSRIRRENTPHATTEEAFQPQCCSRATGGSDGKSICQYKFQALFQYTLGMQFSVVTQVAGICISALHESSGYSFSLMWADKEASGDVELMYRLESLGTYERVAPEWMREVIKFSASMCPVFFNRIARFIDVHR